MGIAFFANDCVESSCVNIKQFNDSQYTLIKICGKFIFAQKDNTQIFKKKTTWN